MNIKCSCCNKSLKESEIHGLYEPFCKSCFDFFVEETEEETVVRECEMINDCRACDWKQEVEPYSKCTSCGKHLNEYEVYGGWDDLCEECFETDILDNEGYCSYD